MTKPTDQEVVASKAGLFHDLPQPSEAQQVQHAQAEVARKRSEGAVRLLQPNRLQVELRASDLESLLPEDHRARLVCDWLANLTDRGAFRVHQRLFDMSFSKE